MTDLARLIDHTLLKPEATRRQIHKLVAEAMEYGFASACVNGVFAADVAKMLHGSPVRTCVVVGFPLGANAAGAKVSEAVRAVEDGADEIDVVAHLPHLINQDLAAAKAELLEIVKRSRTANRDVVVKVIVESSMLMHDVSDGEAEVTIAGACRAVRESGCEFIKTSTGFHSNGGATVEAVRLLKKHAGGLRVKAAGGIRTREDALAMVEAGADRIGCSSSVAIVR